MNMIYYLTLHIDSNHSKWTSCKQERLWMQMNMWNYPPLHIDSNEKKSWNVCIAVE